MSAQLTCIQWNARGLKKEKLIEFKQNLSLLNPSIVIISETHWNKRSIIKFSSYNIIRKDRDDSFGGVAILVKKNFSFSPISLTVSSKVECVGVSVHVNESEIIHFFSVYCPRGNCGANDLLPIFRFSNNSIICGDFNAHHWLWESNSNCNKSGNSICEILNDCDEITLLTPVDFNTRIDPRSGNASTIDLTFSSNLLAIDVEVKLGPYWGSDHLPIIANIYKNVDPPNTVNSWKPSKSKWGVWNVALREEWDKIKGDIDPSNPSGCYDAWVSAIYVANDRHFKTKQPKGHPKEPPHPFWNLRCKKITAEVRKARFRWRNSPCIENKIALNRLESVKKRIILEEKRNAWDNFTLSLSPQSSSHNIWRFTSNMLGRSTKSSTPLLTNPIKRLLTIRNYVICS